MVQACCERCYSKYLSKKENTTDQVDSDESKIVIDETFLIKNFGKKYTILKEPEEIDEIFKKIILNRGGNLPIATYILVNKKKNKLCMCPCHIHGSHVFH